MRRNILAEGLNAFTQPDRKQEARRIESNLINDGLSIVRDTKTCVLRTLTCSLAVVQQEQ